jgi:type VI secretion system protein ImpC
MKYSMNLGRMTAPGWRRPRESKGPFRIALLADLTGRANRGAVEVGASLQSRRLGAVDIDRLESMLARAELSLDLSLGDETGVSVQIRSLDDFHPDELFAQLEVFDELKGLRRSLQNPSTFPAAAEKVLAWSRQQTAAHPSVVKSASTAVPAGRLSDFARLIGQEKRVTVAESMTDRLLSAIVAPHVVPAADPHQESLVGSVDLALAEALRRVLHHPDFQAAESVWRSIDLLTRRLEWGPELELLLFDITAEELAADLSATDDLDQTGLYKLLVEGPRNDVQHGPLSTIIGVYEFEQSPPHAELLGRLAKIAAAAQAPFLTGISARVLDNLKAADAHPLVVQAWSSLRQMPQAAYLGLVVPRFLLRWPYGKKTEPIDSIPFEEFSPQTGLKGMLWGNGSILAGLLLATTFEQQGLRSMELGSVMTVDDLPVYYYTDRHGDQVALPCAERFIHEDLARALKDEGYMPLLSIRGRPELRLGGFDSVHGSLLAGPWAPLEIEPDEVLTEASARAFAPVAAERGDEEMAADEDEAAADSEEDELDALLAELSAADEADATDEMSDDDIDPDLKKLLEGL